MANSEEGETSQLTKDGDDENCNVASELESVEAWHTNLTDVGQFSYGALCAISLKELYEDVEWHSPFQRDCLKNIVTYLKQPEQVQQTWMSIMKEQDVESQPFVDALKSESAVARNGLICIPRDLVWMAMRSGNYDARLRVLAQYISRKLSIRWSDVEDFERTTIRLLKSQEHQMSEEEKVEKDKKAKVRKIKRYAMIGVATVGGGALLGLTGGLAAPFLAAGAGAIIGGAGAAALGSAAGIAIIGSLFGVAGAGLGGYKMKKRVGDVEEFGFEPLTDEPDVHVTIAVTGWLTEDEPAFQTAWQSLRVSGEQYVLRYESKYLLQMGQGIDYLLSFAMNAAVSETLKYTILSGIIAAVAWPAVLLSASSVIDNPWSVCTNRTVSAGRQLAEVLLARQQGKRPVTLVGFSLGARVIYYCLQELTKRKNAEGIIEDVVILGAPVPASSTEWKKFSRIVAGTIVNGYCRTDWLLKFLYRTASAQISIAGLQAINWQHRRMVNLDLTHMITGHMDYRKKLNEILAMAGVKIATEDIVVQEASEATEDIAGSYTIIETPTKQGYVTPISGYQNRMTKSVSLQSGIAQVEREQNRVMALQTLENKRASAQAAGMHKSHSDDEILDITHGKGHCVKNAAAKTKDDSITGTKTAKDSAKTAVSLDHENMEMQSSMDKGGRPQSLPITSWDELGADKNAPAIEERGVASGSSSPNIMEEISGTISKIEQLNKVDDDIASREKASHGEWYGSSVDKESIQRTMSHDHTQLTSSQESIEA